MTNLKKIISQFTKTFLCLLEVFCFFNYVKRIGRWVHICRIICDVVNTLMASFWIPIMHGNMVGSNDNNNRYLLTVPYSHPWKNIFKKSRTNINLPSCILPGKLLVSLFWLLTSTSLTFYYSHVTLPVPQTTKVVYPPRLHDVNMLILHFVCLSCYCLRPKKIRFTLTGKPG